MSTRCRPTGPSVSLGLGEFIVQEYHRAAKLIRGNAMKDHCEVVIDADVKTVWKILDDVDSMKKWQPSLVSITHKSGVPGQPGAVSEIGLRREWPRGNHDRDDYGAP